MGKKEKNGIIPDSLEEMKSSRRSFLKASAVGAGVFAATAAGISGLTGCGGADYSADTSIPDKWDAEFDVVVIGSGFAGLSAAIEAKRAGASVVVLEKMSTYGGNSVINGGYLAVPNSDLQKKEGIKDSVDLFVKDLLAAGRGLNHEKLIRTIAKEAKAAYDFTVDCGAEYKPKLSHLGGHSVARSYYTKIGSGAGIVKPLQKTAEKEGVKLMKKTKMEGLITAKDGRVVGVVTRTGYTFGNEGSGKIRKFKANKGVILGSGGFSQDERFRSAQDPRLGGTIDSTNQKGATAEALSYALNAGATPIHVSRIQLGPWACPDEKGFGYGSPFNIDAGFPYGIMVEKNTGKRFVNELADRKTRADAMLAHTDKKGNPVYPIIVTDSNGASHASKLDKALETGVVKKFDSLKALASNYGVPLNGLQKSIDAYNAAVAKGMKNDPDFGKPIPDDQKKIEKAPFYALRGWPKVHHTMGGVQINTNAEVLKMNSDDIIKGLFAAGEAVGGPHGASRLGSCAITDCLVFGRIAGKSAAKNDSWG